LLKAVVTQNEVGLQLMTFLAKTNLLDFRKVKCCWTCLLLHRSNCRYIKL